MSEDTQNTGIQDDIIDKYHGEGFQIIPVNGKLPLLKNWKEFQTEPRQESTDINHMPWDSATGIALLCGPISGGLYVIDIDSKNDETGKIVNEVREILEMWFPSFVRDTYIEKTPSGGLHIVFKCSVSRRKKILAKTSDNKTILELLGEGNYCVFAPSLGYETLQGDLSNVPTLSPTMVRGMLEHLQKLDRTVVATKGNKAEKMKISIQNTL